MPRKPATTATPDPLADLREPEDAARYPEDDQNGPQDGPGAPDGADPLATLVGEACGAVSMCWDPTPEGVFHSEAAAAIVDDLLDAIRPLVEPAAARTADDVVDRWHADTVALGFLHKGGRCGCAYIARVAFGA